MSLTETLQTLCDPGGRLDYEVRMAGEAVARSFMRWTKEAGTHRLDFVVDRLAPFSGLGSLPGRAEASVVLPEDRLAPLSYRRGEAGKSWSVAFKEDTAQAELPDGSSVPVRTGAVAALLDTNLIGLTALALAVWWREGSLTQGRVATVFLGSQLTTAPYHVSPAGDADRFESSFKEAFLLDRDGRLVRSAVALSGVVVERLPANAFAPSQPPGIAKPRAARRPAADLSTRTITVSHAGVDVAADLIRPDESSRSLPGVLFLAGSGSIDRFGMAGPIDTGLRQWADDCARAGFACLIADRPGSGDTKHGARALERGFENLIGEAAAALAALRSAPSVDSGRICVVGQSLGGLVAMLIAAGAGPVQVCALVATPGRPLPSVILDQLSWQASRVGLPADTLQAQRAEFQAFVAAVLDPEPWAPGRTPDRFLVQAHNRVWLKALYALQPLDLVRSMACPMFIAQGGLDVQVSPTADFDALVQAAERNGIAVTRALYPDLDHLMMPATPGQDLDAYHDRERRVSHRFLGDLTGFLTAHLA